MGLCDRRFTSAYLYGAICPATGEDFALVLPKVSAPAMTLFLDGLSRSIAPDVHILLVLDQAGWHKARTLTVPDNITLLLLPGTAPNSTPSSASCPCGLANLHYKSAAAIRKSQRSDRRTRGTTLMSRFRFLAPVNRRFPPFSPGCFDIECLSSVWKTR